MAWGSKKMSVVHVQMKTNDGRYSRSNSGGKKRRGWAGWSAALVSPKRPALMMIAVMPNNE